MPSPEAHEAMVQRVIAAGKQVGTPTGIHVMSAEDALRRAEQGMQFLAVESDLRMLSGAAEKMVKTLWPEGSVTDLARY